MPGRDRGRGLLTALFCPVFLAVTLLPAFAQDGAPAASSSVAYPWPHSAGAETLVSRFPTPTGCVEPPPSPGSFPSWLADLPLAAPGTEVRARGGEPVRTFSPALAVLDLDLLGPQDCADTAIRLRSEFLWTRGETATAGLAWRYLSGDATPWDRWAEGCRPVLNLLRSRVARWACGERSAQSHETFRDWLGNVMRYANSSSLARDLDSVAPEDLRPGDLVVQPHPRGVPGHVALVARRAECGESARYLFVNGFLPPQSVHVIGLAVATPPTAWLTLREYRYQMSPLGTDYTYSRFPTAPGE